MIAVVGVIVLITILTWVVVAQALFMGNYQQLERNDVQDALDATSYALDLSVSDMNQTARDYASWDDTYSFVVNNNTNYITTNLVESTFQNLRLNLLFIENTDGKIVVAKAYDLVNGSFVALPGELDSLASTDSPLFFHNESTGTSTGIVSTANGSLIVASQPILTSERAGPIHGTLVFGRYLTPDVLTAIAGPGKAVSAYPFGAQSLEQVQRVKPALAGGASSVIEPVNATTVVGFMLLRDIYGNPSLVIEVALPRTIYQAGLSSTNTFLGLLVISGVISLTCMVWSLRQSVLAPLSRINTSLARIRTSDDLSKRVPERGDVELVWLAHAINATLASLESSHAERDAAADELLENEEMLRLVLNASEDAISLVDTNEVFLTANEALAHRLGVPAAEVIGMKGFTEKPEDIAKQRRARFARAIATKLPVHFDDEHAGRQLENVYQPLVDARGNVTKVAVFSRDITERKRAEEQIITSLREKELLLSEIHHRVKNNLQIVSSLLSLQSDYVTDADALAMFRESQQRVKSMALIHEKLYQSEDFAHIDFSDYLAALSSYLVSSYHLPSVRLVTEGCTTSVDITAAIPCGLIVNELVTNAFEHAFPDGRAGTITVSLCTDEAGTHVLSVSDDGVGFPEDLDFRNTKSLGLQLVTGLVNQLDGTITLDRTKGTTFIITFKPKDAYAPSTRHS
ncbi:MAG: CHASE4 domain-containing protein [Halobacteriota archaeon]